MMLRQPLKEQFKFKEGTQLELSFGQISFCTSIHPLEIKKIKLLDSHFFLLESKVSITCWLKMTMTNHSSNDGFKQEIL